MNTSSKTPNHISFNCLLHSVFKFYWESGPYPLAVPQSQIHKIKFIRKNAIIMRHIMTKATWSVYLPCLPTVSLFLFNSEVQNYIVLHLIMFNQTIHMPVIWNVFSPFMLCIYAYCKIEWIWETLFIVHSTLYVMNSIHNIQRWPMMILYLVHRDEINFATR